MLVDGPGAIPSSDYGDSYDGFFDPDGINASSWTFRGLVSIPIKLYTTSESGSSISFNMLHECGTRLKQQYVCPKEGERN